MYVYRKATIEDIPLLVQFRVNLLHSAIGDGEATRWEHVKEQLVNYYEQTLPQESHIAYLAYDGSRCVWTGGVCFYRVLPTYVKPTGQKAYIINMYTDPEYRRRGIAMKILDKLVNASLRKGVRYISLEATTMGRPLYEKYGFGMLKSEMQYMNETYEG